MRSSTTTPETVLAATGQAGRAFATVAVTSGDPDGAHRFTVTLEVASPWHVFAPGASEGLPVEISVDEPARIADVQYETGGASQTLRRAVISGEISDARPGTALRLRTQACDGARCEGPAVMLLALTPAVGPEQV